MATSSAESSCPTFNILLLGETGVGKSTFINAFVNYAMYDNLAEAEKEGLTHLISTKFTVTDDNYKPRVIQIGTSENENQRVGASATQSPTSYIFNVGNANICLIDTPGVGDTRGADQDKINFDKLLHHIGELKELHAICILLKPNEARITVMFEYCIKELLSRLEKSASQNIVFVFTNSRGTFYRPGETLTSLQALFEETRSQPPYVEIPLSKANVFCIDNESFRFLLILRNGIRFTDVERKNFVASWEQSSNECLRMITHIASLTPHKVQDTISVNEARRLIVQLSQPLADIAEMIQQNITVLQRKNEELTFCSDNVEQLKKSLHIPVITLKVEELKHPRTVCTAQKCCKSYQVDGKETFHFQKPCCDPCTMKDTQTAILGNPQLIWCKAMLTKSESLPVMIYEGIFKGIKNLASSFSDQQRQKIECTVCGCSYNDHKHIYYHSERVEENIVNENINSQIQTKENAKMAAAQTIREIELRSCEYQSEQEIINKSIARFAHFLQNNAITPYNDAYEHFLEYAIDREKSSPYPDKQRVQLFENMLRSYIKEKETLEAALRNVRQSDTSSSLVTAADVMETVESLYGLKHCGAKIKEMYQKQTAARKSENTKEREVPVEIKKKGGIFKRLYNVIF